jgi:hypothetical protein
VSRVWGRELKRLAALSSAHEPAIVVGGEKVRVVAVLDLELCLARDRRRVRLTAGGGAVARQRQPDERQPVDLGVEGVEVRLLVRRLATGVGIEGRRGEHF